MKSAKFKYQSDRFRELVFGSVTLKDDGKVSISINNPSHYCAAHRFMAKKFANEIVAADFIDDGAFEVKSSNKGLIDILRKETESLKVQFIEKTKVYARISFDNMDKELNMPMRAWYERYGISFKESERIYHGSSTLEPESKEYNGKNLYKMRDRMALVKNVIAQGFDKYEANEVKWAEIHYEDSLLKLSERIQQKGLDESKLSVKTSHIGVNIDTTLTDGVKTVKAWTIIAEGPIQRPHYRYLIK